MDLQTTLLFITASVNSLLSLFVLFGKRDRTNIVYSVFVLFASFWSIGLGFFIQEIDFDRALYIANFYYVAAAGIPLFFYYFSLVFPAKEFKLKVRHILASIPFLIIIFLLIFQKNLLIEKIFLAPWGKDVYLNFNNYFIYTIYFIFFTILAYSNLIKSFSETVKHEEKNQLKFVLVGTIVGFIFGMVFDLFLPMLGNYKYIFIGPIFSFSMVLAIAYSITKHHLFDIKVIATELIVFILWIAIIIRTLVANTLLDQILNGSFLVVAVVLGILLIKSVIQEVQQREKIENLAKDLEKANARLTELDQLKSEFLSLATHQIRAPLTAVKGYASLLLEGDFGQISEPVKGAVQTIFNSCQNLVVIVNEFLDISRIEQGRMKYDLTDFDAELLTEEIIKELRPNIEKANLTVDIHKHTEGSTIAHTDQGKVKQIIGNIIDNAIKYTPEGGITISVTATALKTLIEIKDTGIGIAKDDIPKLFGKFVRAKDANKTNVIGTGLGLYVAKQMIEAQKGRIWVESDGVGTGSRFYIELPKS